MTRKTLGLWLAAFGLLTLGGCVSQPARDPAYAATRPPLPLPPERNTGAIYQPGNSVSLFEDSRAHRVGDIITIVLEEKTTGSKEANTSTAKDTSISMDNPTLFGASPSFTLPDLKSTTGGGNTGRDNTLAFGVASSNSFDGAGSSDQKNSLTGTISVTVSEVLPNGNLMVRGQKSLALNQGEEFIRIAGIVRPQDISTDNKVSSTRVADAEITYSGTGAVADANGMGWLARFFISALMPF